MDATASISTATAAVDQKEAAEQTLRELLSFIEDAAAYIAHRARGQTTATPERRRLRADIERAVSAYLEATTGFDASRDYTPAPEDMVKAMLAQSMVSPVGSIKVSLPQTRAAKVAEAA